LDDLEGQYCNRNYKGCNASFLATAGLSYFTIWTFFYYTTVHSNNFRALKSQRSTKINIKQNSMPRRKLIARKEL